MYRMLPGHSAAGYRRSPHRYPAALLLLIAALLPVVATAGGGVDAVLLMDSSGSMAKNDPDKLRVPAAKMFMSLLGEQDRIGLISFSDNGYPVLHLTAPGPDHNARILAAADKVSSRGVYTNLHAALEKGLAMLEKEGQAGQEKMLVLMSDGKMDVGDTDEDWALTRKLRGELLQAAKESGVKVYTIAFTEASDMDLLKELANETGALFKLARSDQDLHEVFSAIFESAKDPDMLPIEGGEFVVDDSIEEVTIVASKEREDVRIYLQSPQGRKLDSDTAGENVKWFVSHHFDMITLKKPEPGTWKLLYTGGRNRAYIVTNMSLNHNPQNPSLEVGKDMVLETWLEQDGKLLDREAVLTNTRFEMEIEDPNGNSVRFDLFDRGEYGDRKPADGIYSNTLSYENPGDYRLSIIAKGETFERQKTVHFEVAAPPPGLEPPAPEPASTEPVAEKAPEPIPPAEVESAVEEPAEAPPAAEPEAAEPEPAPEPAKKKGISLGLAIGVFIGINLLLGGIGFAVWWFLKKRKTAAAAADTEDEEDGDDEEESAG
ncbi:MAG TPA: VWA domain-containing protein [Gammaproteobacteria bacterium]|nr:VWA domain-containing protein [Gammaproteobacteria bacterium]